MTQLVGLMRDSEWIVRQSAAVAVGEIAKQQVFDQVGEQEVRDGYEDLKRELENGIDFSDEELNVRRALILQLHFQLTGMIESKAIEFLAGYLGTSQNITNIKIIVNVLGSLAAKGSSQAREILEAVFSQIERHITQEGPSYIINAKEQEIVKKVIESSDTKTLLRIYLNDRLPSGIRFFALQRIAPMNRSGNIDLQLRQQETLLAVLKKVTESMKQNPGNITFKDILPLFDSMRHFSPGEKESVLNEVVTPLFFKNPEDLTISGLNHLADIFSGVSGFKYFLFYISTRKRAPPEVKQMAQEVLSRDGKLLPLRETVRERISQGEARVLVVHNIKDGQGDELIRMHTFIQALLDFNPRLSVTVVTGRPYLYGHPRVNVIPIDGSELKDVFAGDYDVVVDHYDKSQRYSDDVEKFFQSSFDLQSRNALSRLVAGALKGKKIRLVYIRTNKSNDNFIFEKVNVNGADYETPLGLDKVKAANVYDPIFRLLAELGIPFGVGEENNKKDSLVTAVPYLEAKSKWVEMMATIENYDSTKDTPLRPVVVINPFGGESEGKGYARKEQDVKELRDHMHVLISSGLKIVILPNGKDWGTRDVAQKLVDGMEAQDQKSIVVAPGPQEDPRFFKYFLSYADYLVTVEGGMMHLGYILGKPMGVVLKSGAGPAKWIPFGISENQEIVSGADAAAERYRSMNARRIQRSVEPVSSKAGPGHPSDSAMMGDSSTSVKQNPGGIDFNFDLLELEIQGQGADFNLPIANMNIQQIHIDGLMPVIINITPITNLPFILGASEKEEQQLSQVLN
jgi:hypothetical protein